MRGNDCLRVWWVRKLENLNEKRDRKMVYGQTLDKCIVLCHRVEKPTEFKGTLISVIGRALGLIPKYAEKRPGRIEIGGRGESV